MTATNDVTIWCDVDTTADRMSCGEWITEHTAARARKLAQRQGWKTVRSESGGALRDLCPEHARGNTERSDADR